jgi:ribosomal-protein-alanine N-acetyltransferase
MSDVFVTPLSTRLLGPRIVLRPPKATDIPELRSLLRDNADHLRPFSPAPARGSNPLSLTELSRSIARQRREWKNDGAYVFLVAMREPDEPIVGRIALTAIARGPFQNAYLGYWIAASHQRLGLMTEAVGVALRFAFDTIGLHRVQAAVMPHNAASRRILTKRRFREEGLARRYLCIAGSWEDHVLYAITREEWDEDRGEASS